MKRNQECRERKRDSKIEERDRSIRKKEPGKIVSLKSRFFSTLSLLQDYERGERKEDHRSF